MRQTQKREVIRFTAETVSRLWLLFSVLIAGGVFLPEISRLLNNEAPLTMKSEDPSIDNLDEIMVEIFSDPVGDFGIFFPFVQEVLLQNAYPYDRTQRTDLSRFADLPILTPDSVTLRGVNARWSTVFSVSLRRMDEWGEDGFAQLLISIHPPDEPATRRSFVLDPEGEAAYRQYLDEVSRQVVSWNETQVVRNIVSTSVILMPDELGEPSDSEVFFEELNRLGIPGGRLTPSTLNSLSWERSYQVVDSGQAQFVRQLRVAIPNFRGSGPPFLYYRVRLNGDEITVEGDVDRFSTRVPASTVPYLVQMMTR